MNNLESINAVSLFLQRWPLEQVYRLTLDDYIDSNRGLTDKRQQGSIDTFCYWAEYSFERAKLNSLAKTRNGQFIFNPTQWKRYGIVLNRSFSDYREKNPPQNLREIDESERVSSSEAEQSEETDFADELELSAHGFAIQEWDDIEADNSDKDSPSDFDFDEFGIWGAQHSFVGGNEMQVRDELYSWRSVYGSNAAEAFNNIHRDITRVVESSLKKDFQAAATTLLPDSFALRVAYLYAPDDLVPIFRRRILERCAFALGFVSGDADWASLQRFICDRRPISFQDNFHYAVHLLRGVVTGDLDLSPPLRRVSRVSTRSKPIESQVRRAVASYTVEQRHNLIQNELHRKLVARFGEDMVTLEENWVDVKLYRPDEIIFYEVKSDLNASACIRNALGQGLNYIYLDGDSRNKKLVVVGPVPPNEQDRLFIQFLKTNLRLDFEYEWIAIPESH